MESCRYVTCWLLLISSAFRTLSAAQSCTFDSQFHYRSASLWFQGHKSHARLKICACIGDGLPTSSRTPTVALSADPNCSLLISQSAALDWDATSTGISIDPTAGEQPSLIVCTDARVRIIHTGAPGRLLYVCQQHWHVHTWNYTGIAVHPQHESNFPLQTTGKRNRRAVAVVKEDIPMTVVTGFRVEDVDKGVTYEDGTPVVLAGAMVTMRLFGSGFSNSSEFRFVLDERQRGERCEDSPFTVSAHVDSDSVTMHSAVLHVRLPGPDQVGGVDSPSFYLCLRTWNETSKAWIHQGNEPGLRIRTYMRLLPLWVQACIIVILLALSGLFSGLNLGLMALDRTELKLYENTGSDREKRYAKAIIPIRNHGNFLLCTLLLGNVLVNSSVTILLDDLTSGIVAIIGSTLGIVILGEIIPQAICSRFGLAIGAHTVWITKFFMVLTLPLSYPISLILDQILGEEIGAYYNRERLKELIKVTNEYHDLEKDEVNIIAGALELRKKTVADIMTRLEDVFMLSVNAKLDFETVSEIMKQGYSRIPVFEEDRSKIVNILFIKDLALVDPDDETPLKTLCQFYNNPCNFVFEDTKLDVMFKEFKEGAKGHMAFVQRVNCEGEGDPFYETIGLVTLEDVIEELIQAEIVDETDVYIDNRSKRKREKGKLLQDFTAFAHQRRGPSTQISPQLALAAYQYLSTSLDAFKGDLVSESVLRRLLQQRVVKHVKVKSREIARSDPATLIYQQGKPCDYFVLVLEGRVEVTVGKENLTFDSGSFTHFGMQALSATLAGPIGESPSSAYLLRGSMQSVQGATESCSGSSRTPLMVFIPDYSVRAICEVIYVKINRSLYQAARKATLLERAHKHTENQRPCDFDAELDQVLNAANNEENCEMGSPQRSFAVDRSRGINRRTYSMCQDDPDPTAQQPFFGREENTDASQNDILLARSLPATPIDGLSCSSLDRNPKRGGSRNHCLDDQDRPKFTINDDDSKTDDKESLTFLEDRVCLLNAKNSS